MRQLRPTLPLILAAALALGLSGCARTGPPAPVVYGSGGPGGSKSADGGTASRGAPGRTTRQQTAADGNWARTGRAGIHTVAKGESVYALARRYQVPIRAIIDVNNLEPPYTLYVGQEIRIPVPRRHVVERGDTVYGISRAYGVDMSELTRLNDIQPPYTIKPGQVLVIPGRGEDATATRIAGRSDGGSGSDNADGGAGAGRAQTTSARESGGAGTRRTEARSGGQDRSDPSDARDSTAVAGLPDAPAGTPTPPRPPARKSEGTQQTQTAARSEAGDAEQQARAQQTSAPKPASIPQPPPRAEARFLWPVRGKVLSGFGPMEGGLHNDGINIAAPAGTPIKAAENGVVVYLGNELRGFGNLLLLKHADGWVTAYAHTQEILVRHGQQVKRGQLVARVGSTGSVAQPQLHFEIRQGSKAKDPAQLLGSQQAAR